MRIYIYRERDRESNCICMYAYTHIQTSLYIYIYTHMKMYAYAFSSCTEGGFHVVSSFFGLKLEPQAAVSVWLQVRNMGPGIVFGICEIRYSMVACISRKTSH